MRILNSNEQDLCNRILNGHGGNNYLGNIIYHKLGGVCISVTRNPKLVELEFTSQNASQIPSEPETEAIIVRINEISIDILEVVTLINILEKEGYILLLQRSSYLNTLKFGRCIDNMNSVIHHFVDEKIAELLIEYVNKEIYVTEEFREFCKHGYLARDERRFRRQNINAIIAISAAMFAALTNLFFNGWNKISGTRIKQEQISSLTAELKAVQIKLDSLNLTAKKTITTIQEQKLNVPGSNPSKNPKTK